MNSAWMSTSTFRGRRRRVWWGSRSIGVGNVCLEHWNVASCYEVLQQARGRGSLSGNRTQVIRN